MLILYILINISNTYNTCVNIIYLANHLQIIWKGEYFDNILQGSNCIICYFQHYYLTEMFNIAIIRVRTCIHIHSLKKITNNIELSSSVLGGYKYIRWLITIISYLINLQTRVKQYILREIGFLIWWLSIISWENSFV